jgi:hypothetical protein
MSQSHGQAIRATVLAVLAVCLAPADTAHAQFFDQPYYGVWRSHHPPARHRHRQRRDEPRAAEKEQIRRAPKPNGPLQIVVSIAEQRIAVYDNGALLARSSVSTGVPDHPTPTGVFSVISKNLWHRSNLYSAAPMPFMQRLTWSGIALHAGPLPGRPASHGCIRLKRDFAVRLWQLTRRGTRVIIAANDTSPLEIASPRLFAVQPKAPSDPPASSPAGAESAVTAAAAQPSSTPDAGTQGVTDPAAPASARPAVAARNAGPISVFVSRKSMRLFVRQGSTPLFDSPVTIRDPDEPLGTHVFTAMKIPEGAAPRWTVMSMPEKSRRAPQASGHAPGKRVAETGPASSPDTASAALDRIDIAPDVVERIAQRVTPGSSLIVSDHAISRETGQGTDFIVVMP